MTTLTLDCRCGAVQLAISAEPIVQLYCHCDDCQAVHGAAYVPESVYPAAAVQIVRGNPTHWKLKRNPRVTCAECGTRLFIDVPALGFRGVNGALLPKDQFNASFHMHCQYAVLPIKDDLPHYKARPTRFGGTEEQVDW